MRWKILPAALLQRLIRLSSKISDGGEASISLSHYPLLPVLLSFTSLLSVFCVLVCALEPADFQSGSGGSAGFRVTVCLGN
jgi:hypothetical protein